jgi:hypothetical protein
MNLAKIARRLFKDAEIPAGKRTDIPAITAEEVVEARAFFPLDKFFIFGHARSGTTLLTRLVRLHPQVHCNYQAHFFTRAPLLEALVSDESVGSWLARRSNRWNGGRDLSPLVLRAAADFIMERDARQASKGAPDCKVGDKSPNSLMDGEAVNKLVKVYPDARLIFIVRDGRDAVISHRFQAFVDNPQGLSPDDQRLREMFAKNPEPFLSGKQSLFNEKLLRREAEGWAHNVVDTDASAHQLLLGGNQYLSLRYEDLLQNPLGEMTRLWSFLGVETSLPGLKETLEAEMLQNPDADWQGQKASEIASALQKGKRGTWREILTEKDKQLFWNVAGEVLERWGYQA